MRGQINKRGLVEKRLANGTDDVMEEISEERKKRSPVYALAYFPGGALRLPYFGCKTVPWRGTQEICAGRKRIKRHKKIDSLGSSSNAMDGTRFDSANIQKKMSMRIFDPEGG